MSVDSTNPEYDKNVHRWDLVRNVVRSNVKQYIFDVDPNDAHRNKRYKESAKFTNLTSRTRNSLVGQVFRKESIIELPPSIEYLKTDATGQDVDLEKVAQEATGEVLMSGRYGLLVDYPPANEGLSAAQVEAMNLKARIYRYNAESIINWQTENVNGAQVVTMIVLKEEVNSIGDDGFRWKAHTQFRVLRLVDGVYIQSLYKDKEDEDPIMYQPRNSRGEAFNYIPFVFIGSEDNDTACDPSPLFDIAEMNIGHLRNSADYEESIFIAGQPTLFITTDISAEDWERLNPDGILLGSRKGHNLGQSGQATMLQPNENQLPDKAMQRKEEQIVMMGGRISGQGAANETAEAARGRHSGEASTLQIIRNNVNDAIWKSCAYVLDYMGSEAEADQIKININDDFFEKSIDAPKMLAQLQLYNAGVVAKSDIRDALRKYNEIDPSRTDEDIDAELEADFNRITPFGGE
jgi:hypothetical protein